jgi:hypothetical protein
MEFLSHAELRVRTKEILNNMVILSNKGQISLHGRNETGNYWMVKWTDALEEFALRYGPYPNGFSDGSMKDAPIVNPTYPASPPAKDAIGSIQENCIYKFGKNEHLAAMFKYGRIRIAPASYYADPSLNNAIQDDELSFIVESRADQLKIQDEMGQRIHSFGKVTFHLKSETNYYVHCFAAQYTYREYEDFEAETCIVITEPRKLFQKMMKAVRVLKPDFKGFSTPVKYLDPLTCDPNDINIFISKHFRYSYQNEVRTIWLPNSPTENLEPFFIEVGSLQNFAKFITIPKQ